MNTIKAWIHAFRLRTLPLSFSNIFLGLGLASIKFDINYLVLAFIVITTLLLQIVSNLANDYGDAKKGTDNDQRIGPERAVQSGVISLKEMKIGIIISSTLALLSGLYLLLITFNGQINISFILFLSLGVLSILAAIKYTVGKKAYGYSGLGDLFVFVFFGLVGVIGTYYLLTKSINFSIILPAITMGTLSTAVLNLNNMRDIENDRKAGKRTLVVKIGAEKSKKYHYSLFFWSYLSYFVFCYITFNITNLLYNLIPLLVIGVIHGLHIKRVKSISNPKDFDKELKIIALSSLLFSVLVFISIMLIK